MKLRGLTVSGADDDVDRGALDALAEEFPFVEWGILLSNTRAGTPRYPSTQGLTRLSVGSPAGRIAYHLCGAAARSVLAGEGPEGHPFVRFQVNGFTEHALGGKDLAPFARWVEKLTTADCGVILQIGNRGALEVARRFAYPYPTVEALYDESGGTGIATTRWPDMPVELPLGYAGGLTPDNLEWYIRKLDTMEPFGALTWLDMESGVRTDNRFDLTKVRRVLEVAGRFVCS